MNPTSPDALNNTFAALADPTRRAILARLTQGETSVGDLVKPFAISGPAISRHLRVLENAHLIERKVDAQWRICRLNPPGLQVASDWLSQYRDFWEDRLDQLVEVLEKDDSVPAVPLAVHPAPGADPAAPKPPTARRATIAPRPRPIRSTPRIRKSP